MVPRDPPGAASRDCPVGGLSLKTMSSVSLFVSFSFFLNSFCETTRDGNRFLFLHNTQAPSAKVQSHAPLANGPLTGMMENPLLYRM